MAEWLESKALKGWFWKEIGSNVGEWFEDAPLIVKTLFWLTAALFCWLLLVEKFPDAIGHIATPKSVVRGTGAFLQLSGFLVAAYGLDKSLERFGRTPSTSRILPWLHEFRSIFDTTIQGSLYVQDAPATLDVEGFTADIDQHEDLSLEEQFEELNERIDELETEVHSRIDEEVERLEDRIGERFGTVKEEVQDVQEKMKEVNVGELTLGLEWVGVSLLIYGLFLSSFPSLFLSAEAIFLIPAAIIPPLLLLNSM